MMNFLGKLAVAGAVLGVSACATTTNGGADGVASDAEISFRTIFAENHKSSEWKITETYSNSGWDQVMFSRQNVSFGDTGLKLRIRDAEYDDIVYSGEYQRRGWYGYGRYEVTMRAAQGSGVMTGFLTHTNGDFGDIRNEINFSFIGRDTTKVVATAAKGPIVSRSRPISLPFDAAEGYHNYAFEWSADALRWFVEGEMVFEVTDPEVIPDTAQRILMSLVAGTEKDASWMGVRGYDDGVSAKFACVAYLAPGDEDAKSCFGVGATSYLAATDANS